MWQKMLQVGSGGGGSKKNHIFTVTTDTMSTAWQEFDCGFKPKYVYYWCKKSSTSAENNMFTLNDDGETYANKGIYRVSSSSSGVTEVSASTTILPTEKGFKIHSASSSAFNYGSKVDLIAIAPDE